jgi:propanediol dehydratase small subunit
MTPEDVRDAPATEGLAARIHKDLGRRRHATDREPCSERRRR